MYVRLYSVLFQSFNRTKNFSNFPHYANGIPVIITHVSISRLRTVSFCVVTTRTDGTDEDGCTVALFSTACGFSTISVPY